MFRALYQKGNDVYSSFLFESFFAQDNRYIEWQIDETEYVHKSVDGNEIQADFYQALDPGETNNLIWIDENVGIVFEINGFLDEAVILHIAQSIIWPK